MLDGRIMGLDVGDKKYEWNFRSTRRKSNQVL